MAGAEELERLVTDLESDRVERQASFTDPDKIRQAVCAFANDLPGHRAPGYVFVGIDDAEAPASLAITDRLLQTLADIRSDGNDGRLFQRRGAETERKLCGPLRSRRLCGVTYFSRTGHPGRPSEGSP